jgi:hypothetical protein
MSSETRGSILDIIADLAICPLGHSTFTMENWLYGSFDGYDYSEIAIPSRELASIKEVDPELAAKIAEIFATIKNYPTAIYA